MEVDILNGAPGSDMDLSTEASWDKYKAQLRGGDVQALFIATDCKTFSRCRIHPGGPRPLRDKKHPYGFSRSYYSPEELDTLRTGTYFALKSAEVFKMCVDLRIPCMMENPEPWDPEHVSIWDLEEYVSLMADPRVKHVDFDQCRWAAETTKPTRIIATWCDPVVLSLRCNHPPQYWQYTDIRGRLRSSWGSHPPLVGRSRDGVFASAAAAAYTVELNSKLADILSEGIA